MAEREKSLDEIGCKVSMEINQTVIVSNNPPTQLHNVGEEVKGKIQAFLPETIDIYSPRAGADAAQTVRIVIVEIDGIARPFFDSDIIETQPTQTQAAIDEAWGKPPPP